MTESRADRRADVDARIMDVARRQLAEQGPAGLAMRSIARELGMTPGALYRYVADRDALLTRLIVGCYERLGDRLEVAAASGRSSRARWLAVWRAARAWALANRHEFALIYGTPVIGYAAPDETIAPASRITAVLAGIVLDARIDGSAVAADAGGGRSIPALAPELRADLAQARAWAVGRFGDETVRAVPDGILLGVIRAWTELIGTISFELAGHYLGSIDHPAAYLDAVADRHASELGLSGD